MIDQNSKQHCSLYVAEPLLSKVPSQLEINFDKTILALKLAVK